jgi:hypothetical protein
LCLFSQAWNDRRDDRDIPPEDFAEDGTFRVKKWLDAELKPAKGG